MKNNLVRIIGGEWRSRRLPFANVAGLRPTPDRVRETVFNWLQRYIPEARCLDLFAGSGALGFEARSRGAGEVVMVEKHAAAAQCLRQNIELLHATHIQLIHDDAFRYLQRETVGFDVIFLDPPFRKEFVLEVLTLIYERQLLKPNGMIYLEHEAEKQLDFSAFGWIVYRQAKAGQLVSLLLTPVTDDVK